MRWTYRHTEGVGDLAKMPGSVIYRYSTGDYLIADRGWHSGFAHWSSTKKEHVTPRQDRNVGFLIMRVGYIPTNVLHIGQI